MHMQTRKHFQSLSSILCWENAKNTIYLNSSVSATGVESESFMHIGLTSQSLSRYVEEDACKQPTPYQKSVCYLRQLALEGDSLSNLYQETKSLIIQELKVEACFFWKILADQDTLFPVGLDQFEHDRAIIQNPGCERRSLKTLLDKAQVSHQASLAHADEQSCLLKLGPCKYGILISGPSHPVGVVVLQGESTVLEQSHAVTLLQEIASVLAIAIERKRSEMLLLTQTEILKAIASGKDFAQTLYYLCSLLEQQNPGAFCSILLLNPDKNQLQSGIAPSLPKEYAEALNGLVIGEQAGSCGTAAYRGKPVYVDDIETNPLWAPFKDLALSHNIRACWSVPFISQRGEVLGTFALSFGIPCKPTPVNFQLMETAASLASIATERFQATKELTKLALHDELTGLFNRSFFIDYLSSRLGRHQNSPAILACEENSNFAVLFFDLDRFKLINDSLGHMAGDQLLQAFAKRIQPHLKLGDIFARLGGDEFAILLEDIQDRNCAKTLAEKILGCLQNPFSLGSRKVFVSTSIGIVYGRGQYRYPKELLRDADTAMYVAKRRYQGGGYTFFDETMHVIAKSRLQLELELRQDVDSLVIGQTEAFSLVYQPIVLLETNKIYGFEVLLRWNHSAQGIISPDKFIAIAEEVGLILPLGNWILERACQQLQKWRSTYVQAQDLSISVNISGKQFLRPELIPSVKHILNATHLPASALRLEVTESVLIETETSAPSCFSQFRDMGIGLSLDDFGTGYSSLSYLRSFPVDLLKIDRSFIQELEEDKSPIVHAIVSLAHGLGMKAVAEGVESTEQLNKLRELDCDLYQGYLFSRPLQVNQVTKLLEQSC